MTRRKDRYQPRAASASQPKTLKTYACARDRTVQRLAGKPRMRDEARRIARRGHLLVLASQSQTGRGYRRRVRACGGQAPACGQSLVSGSSELIAERPHVKPVSDVAPTAIVTDRQLSDLTKRQSSMVALVRAVIAIPLAFRRAAPFGSRAEDTRASCRRCGSNPTCRAALMSGAVGLLGKDMLYEQ